MDRRKSIKILGISAVTPGILLETAKLTTGLQEIQSFVSAWNEWPDMNWAGPEYWGNRLQDWRIQQGKLECLIEGNNRTLHSLTTQLTSKLQSFETSVTVNLLNNKNSDAAGNYAGFRLGAKAVNRFDDYRCAAVFGQGLDAGITYDGKLFIGEQKSIRKISTANDVRLVLQATPVNNLYRITISAYDIHNTLLDDFTVTDIPNKTVTGNIALVVHFANEAKHDLAITAEGKSVHETSVVNERPSAAFSEWRISGSKIYHNAGQSFGPICFAQYTLHKKILKLTAQLTPVENIAGYKVALQIKQNNSWKTIQESTIDPKGRCVNFKVTNWESNLKTPYRIKLKLPIKTGVKGYFYEGTIAHEPIASDKLKVAVFSCNCDHGFPDTEIAVNVKKHKPDMALFLGDQFYEANGAFGIQTFPVEKSYLDYLRKWYMFGWSYRDIFRHIPCAIIPDDHDVYHGNVWGEGGKHAPSDLGWDFRAQDLGGYKMPVAWVNMIQHTQTSHLPDPYDPSPVKQGINVYYTNWNYAGISFAILEDRKFKSAPRNILPPEAKVNNGFIQNPSFNIKEHRDIDAVLLGDRQMKFLNDWSSDWREGAEMKCVLSQTNFCTVATLPKGSITDAIVPDLPIPEPGEYIQGDWPTSDMDSNGWPQKGRDEAVKTIRKCFAFHIAGDQHIATMVHYGVDSFGDAGYAFTGPALNNIWPRRWWPPLHEHQPLPGKPAYTGNFFDGFGNRMTVHAVANPRKTHREPAIVYDRATGYGIVTFDKSQRTIHIECWPRYVDPEKNKNGQYKGWPFTIKQEQNYNRKAAAWLPTIKVNGIKDPMIELVDERTRELVYSIRIKGKVFKPKVFAEGKYTIRVSDPDTSVVKERKNVQAKRINRNTIFFSV